MFEIIARLCSLRPKRKLRDSHWENLQSNCGHLLPLAPSGKDIAPQDRRFFLLPDETRVEWGNREDCKRAVRQFGVGPFPIVNSDGESVGPPLYALFTDREELRRLYGADPQ